MQSRRWTVAALMLLAALALAGCATREVRVAAQGEGEISRLPSLTVVGEGSVEATPDIAYLTVGVQTTAATAQEAQRSNAERMNVVVARLRSLGVAERDLRTSGLSLGPVMDRQQQITGYRAQNNLAVTVRDVSQTGALFDAAVASGANTGGSIRFGFADETALRHQALAAAVADARARAEATARAAGVQLRGIRAISEEGISIPTPRVALPAAAPAVEQVTPIQPGEQRVTARVQIVFDL